MGLSLQKGHLAILLELQALFNTYLIAFWIPIIFITIPSKNKSKIADRLAILEAEIISYLTNLLGNPTAYWELIWQEGKNYQKEGIKRY